MLETCWKLCWTPCWKPCWKPAGLAAEAGGQPAGLETLLETLLESLLETCWAGSRGGRVDSRAGNLAAGHISPKRNRVVQKCPPLFFPCGTENGYCFEGRPWVLNFFYQNVDALCKNVPPLSFSCGTEKARFHQNVSAWCKHVPLFRTEKGHCFGGPPRARGSQIPTKPRCVVQRCLFTPSLWNREGALFRRPSGGPREPDSTKTRGALYKTVPSSFPCGTEKGHCFGGSPGT